MPIGVLREANRAWLCDGLQPRGDVDAVAHQIAVAFLDDVAQMNANAKLDATLGLQARVALYHAGLHFDGAAHRVDDATELDETAIASALDYAAMMRGDGGVDQIAAQPPQPDRYEPRLRCGEPAVADNIGDQDRNNLRKSRS